jgi:hypothetical protein
VSQSTAVDSLGAPGGLAAEDQRHDASGRVLVDPGELVHFDVDACLFPDFTHYAGLGVIRLHDAHARHGAATLLAAAGVVPRVVMEILGRSQISITMDVYTHVVQDIQCEAMSRMDRLLRKRRPGRQ